MRQLAGVLLEPLGRPCDTPGRVQLAGYGRQHLTERVTRHGDQDVSAATDRFADVGFDVQGIGKLGSGQVALVGACGGHGVERFGITPPKDNGLAGPGELDRQRRAP